MIKAGFFSRFVAYVIDSVILLLFFSILAFILFSFVNTSLNGDNFVPDYLFSLTITLFALISYLIPFIYFGFFWHESGQTIGMKLAMIEVVRQNGKPIGFLRAALRGTLGYYISNMFFGLGFLWAALDSKSRTWHDMIFDTYVVDA